LIADEIKQQFWTKPRRRVHALFRRRELESELNEELEHHISLRTDQLVAEGMSFADARRAAVHVLGGIEQVKEECRDTRGVRFLEEVWQDTGYAFRILRKTPAFAFGAVALLAFAIAANMLVAALVNALFSNPLSYRAPQQLVALSQDFTTLHSDGQGFAFSLPEASDLQQHVQSLEQIAAFHYTVLNATETENTERVQGATVSPNLFAVLGIQPLVGNVFDPDQFRDGVIISERLWRRLYESDPALVGKQIRLDDRLRTVLGIMPADFEFPLSRFTQRVQPGLADIWQPIDPAKMEMEDRGSRTYRLVGRLKADTTVRDLNRELELLSDGWKKKYGSIYQDGGLRLSAFPLRREVGAHVKSATLILAAAVLLMWLICAANLVAMLLARAAAARRQMAIRMALGGGPLRLLRQAMSEGLLLAIAGSALGIFFGSLAIVFFRAAAVQSSPFLGGVQLNANPILITVALSLVTALLFGLIPGTYAVRHATPDALRGGHGGSGARVRPHRLQNQLVIGETALALVLLVGAGLLTKSFLRLQNVDPGFKAAGIVTTDISLPETKYLEVGSAADFFSRVAGEVALLPGVSSAAFVSFLPFGGATTDGTFAIEDGPSTGRLQPPDEEIRIITYDYFRALEIPILHGRAFAPTDSATARPVAVVNQALALRYWGTDAVVGKRIKLHYPRDTEWREVVGVVGNIKHNALDAPANPELYLPHSQIPNRRMTLAVRTDRNAREAMAMIRDKVRSIDSQQPVANARTLARSIADSILPRTLAAALVAAFAIVGLLLAAAGIYAVISYATVERGHEFAVRMAVGANRKDIITMVLKLSGRLLSAGALIGMVVAMGASLMLRPILYEVPVFDPVMLLSMLGFLTACGLAAAYLPARRATRNNLAQALAHD
jgi:predicted permease